MFSRRSQGRAIRIALISLAFSCLISQHVSVIKPGAAQTPPQPPITQPAQWWGMKGMYPDATQSCQDLATFRGGRTVERIEPHNFNANGSPLFATCHLKDWGGEMTQVMCPYAPGIGAYQYVGGIEGGECVLPTEVDQYKKDLSRSSWWDRFFKQGGGFAIGVGKAVWESVVGVWDFAGYLLKWFTDSENNAERLHDLFRNLAQLGTREGLQTAWNAVKYPYEEAWSRGSYGEAIGRAVVALVGVGIGAKALSSLEKFRRIGGKNTPRIDKTTKSKGAAEGLKIDTAEAIDTETTSKSFDKYKEMVENLDVSTPRDSAVFYSGAGNRQLAEEFARQNGKTTLEMTEGGKWLDQQDIFEESSQLTVEQATEIWSRLSERFAKGASGNAVGFVQGSRLNSIFNTVESPALVDNPEITNLITGGF